MLLHKTVNLKTDHQPLALADIPTPEPAEDEVLVKIAVCGVCHTEMDEIVGRTPPPRYPVVPGHQAVGRVVQCGPAVRHHREGDRVGVAWIFDA